MSCHLGQVLMQLPRGSGSGRQVLRWGQSLAPKMDMVHVNNDCTGCWLSFRVLAVSSVTTMAGIGPFYHPAFLAGCNTVGPYRPLLLLDTSVRAIGRQPDV
jgi:hypothetical protein